MKLYNIIFPLLAPVLLYQAKRLSRTIPKLPEADGLRQGKIGSGKPLSLLIVGDSAAAGVGVGYQSDGLAGQLSLQLSENFQTQWQLIAKSGTTARATLAHLKKQHTLISDKPDIVLISLGVNDVSSRLSLKQWNSNILVLIEQLFTKLDAKHIVFSLIPPMNKFSALPFPLSWFLGHKAADFNQSLIQLAKNTDGLTTLEVIGDFEVNDMALDGFHPGQVIYQAWGEQAAQHIEKQLGT